MEHLQPLALHRAVHYAFERVHRKRFFVRVVFVFDDALWRHLAKRRNISDQLFTHFR